MKPPGKKKRRSPRRVPRADNREWQRPRRTSKGPRPAAAFSMPLHNRFDGLPAQESGWEPVKVARNLASASPRPIYHHPKRPPSRPKAREVLPARARHEERVQVQLHGNSYFLPGKLEGKAVTFLIDLGCTTNLISRQLFDTLSARVRGEMEPYEGEYGTLADRSCLPFYDIIELTGRVRDQTI